MQKLFYFIGDTDCQNRLFHIAGYIYHSKEQRPSRCILKSPFHFGKYHPFGW